MTGPQKKEECNIPKRITPLSEVKVRNAKSQENAYKVPEGFRISKAPLTREMMYGCSDHRPRVSKRVRGF